MNSGTVPIELYVATSLDRDRKNLFNILVRPCLPPDLRDELPAFLRSCRGLSAPQKKQAKIRFCETHNIGYAQLHDAIGNYKKWQRKQQTQAAQAAPASQAAQAAQATAPATQAAQAATAAQAAQAASTAPATQAAQPAQPAQPFGCITLTFEPIRGDEL